LLVLVFGYCDLEFVWYLVLVIWNFAIEQLVSEERFFFDRTGHRLSLL